MTVIPVIEISYDPLLVIFWNDANIQIHVKCAKIGKFWQIFSTAQVNETNFKRRCTYLGITSE